MTGNESNDSNNVRVGGQLPTRTKRRGGARAGAGRKPRLGTKAAAVRSFTLDDGTVAKIKAWRVARGSSSDSEALRQMVDLADRRRTQVTQHEQRRRTVVQTSAQIERD